MDRIRLTCRDGASSANRCIDDPLLKETKMYIGRFFYENGLDFSAVNSPSFYKMIALLSGRGMEEYQVPTVEELKGWIFKDVIREMHERVDEIRQSWSETGCSILLDGWTDADGRCLVNVIVDCPRGTVYLRSYDITRCVGNMDAMQSFLATVVAEVGIKNVVQIIVNSVSAFMKEAGRVLMEKYRPIYWTVSATYCIEVMLEKIRTMDVVNETLEKAQIITGFIHRQKYLQDELLEDCCSKIRSIRPFVTLENMVMVEESLRQMFSSHPQSSILTSNNMEGRRVGELVGDESFWSRASTILTGVVPLVRAIEWLDKSGKDHMGYVYETIREAKEMIKEGFEHKKSAYSPFCKVIDDVWKDSLYSPLHSAAYYLNPRTRSVCNPCSSAEVVAGLHCCIVRSSEDRRVQDRLIVQTERYRVAMASAAAESEHQRSTLPPAIWWWRYGGECPELQRLAVRILSQTCDGATKFELKRSLAETVVGKGRNERDMVFVRYNMQLQNFVPGRSWTNIVSGQVDDRITDKSSNGVAPKDLEIEVQSLTQHERPLPQRKSKRKIKLPTKLINFVIH